MHRPSSSSPPRIGETKEERLLALACNLKTPIDAYGVTLKQHIVQTFIPTAKQVKATHVAMESKVDVPLESGLLTFNDATRKVDSMAIREEDELKVAYAKSQASLLFALGLGLLTRSPLWVHRTISRNYSRCLRRRTRGASKFILNFRSPWNNAVVNFSYRFPRFRS